MNDIFEIISIEPTNLWSRQEVKNALRITSDHDDNLIDNLINAAINAAEDFTGLCINIRKIKFTTSSYNKYIRLQYIPICKIEKIIINQQELKSEDYHLNQKLNKIHL